MRLQFYVRFSTQFGQSLWVSGNMKSLGNDDPGNALQLTYLNDEFWQVSFEIKNKKLPESIRYRYFLKNKDGEIIWEWANDRVIDVFKKDIHEIQLVDAWNHAGEYENAFFTTPFKNVLFKTAKTKYKTKDPKHYSHIFKVKAPLLQKNEVVCLLGASHVLGEWNTEKPILLSKKDDWWTVKLDLHDNGFPTSYKYGIYNVKEEKFVEYENGNNRLLYSDAAKKKITILHDGFVYLPNNTWKGAGVAIPVFSLRSKTSFGVGEFTDLKLLVDWAKEVGLKMIQLLPINDTTATHTNSDSYPYAAISAFALHPIYINLMKVAGKTYAEELKLLKKKQQELNELKELDYEQVMNLKFAALKELYSAVAGECFASDDYKEFFGSNKHWLIPYAAFCFFRDKNGSSHFLEWDTNTIYNESEIEKLSSPDSATFKEIAFYYFIQYHLHLQLKEAADYAHKKGIVLKGDIPIGIYRYGCDAWVAPELLHMNWQAGAPPDDFTPIGQNWGFPTYNWKKMHEDGFAWWKQRFSQMSNYFDAFRIDHILGFFRIWSIPENEVQGIMGRFIPALPIHVNEFGENGIWFDHYRYCKPYITDDVLSEVFGDQAEKIKEEFLEKNDQEGYDLLSEFKTQGQIDNYFANKDCEETKKIKLGLYDLISNVILFEEEGSQGERFHFRISMDKTSSFRNLIPFVQEKMQRLYINYFYERQDDFWKKEAMHKLPQLKAATNMLVCGEDLGMVPHCVPDVMRQLGILSLEIQRMPKDPGIEFFHPDNAPYLSVVSPSTHDMSTIRSWWEEDPERSQHFFNNILEQHGEAPQTCEAWINRAIVLQHLYSPAMWSIFQLQDILGMSETIRRDNPHEERINVPADPNHLWNYRIHLDLEELIRSKDFNEELKGYVTHSGR